VGALVEVLVDDSTSDDEEPSSSLQYAVVNSMPKGTSDELDVQYLEPCDEDVVEDGEPIDARDVLKLSDVVYSAPLESINHAWAIDDSTAESLCRTMRAAGLQPIAPDHVDDDLGCQYFERLTSDWIVDDSDSEAEPFEPADEKSLSPDAAKFVRDTHDAVREFEAWSPQTAEERNIKNFVSALSGRAQHENEDQRFRRGKAPLASYKDPRADGASR